MGDEDARLQRPDRGGGSLTFEALEKEASDGRVEAGGDRKPAIRDAATLVIVDESSLPPKILVGRRAKGHVFMAGKVVFPGGRLDPGDLRLARGFDLPASAHQRLAASVRSRFGTARAVALALAAIRETWEETGIMLGQRDGDAFQSSWPVWSDFAAEGVRPDPSRLVPFARAITPPHQIRRYDTRFFAVSGDAIAHTVPLDQRPTDEFDHVAWMSLAELREETLAPITRQILQDLEERLNAANLFDPTVAMPSYRRQNERFHRVLL